MSSSSILALCCATFIAGGVVTNTALAQQNVIRLTVSGSSTVAPILLEMARDFEKKYPGSRIDVQTGGSSKGLTDARTGRADIGMVSRAAKPGEDDVSWILLANDGLAMIVHRSNIASAIDTSTVRRIYLRQKSNWSDVGGKSGPITLVHKAEGRSTLEVFLDHMKLANPDIKPDAIVGDNAQGIQTVAANPTAIGYVSVGAAETAARDGVAVKLLAYDGVPATSAKVAANRYPLRRELNLVTRKPIDSSIAAFLDFATSKEAERHILGEAFVPPVR